LNKREEKMTIQLKDGYLMLVPFKAGDKTPGHSYGWYGTLDSLQKNINDVVKTATGLTTKFWKENWATYKGDGDVRYQRDGYRLQLVEENDFGQICP
jgi:hypothetical protein